MAAKVLFILKLGFSYGTYSTTTSSGLYNSALFVANMLTDSGIPSKVVQVTDNNDIDREVNAFKPTHVIIEALWVVPDKFQVLTRLYPCIQWIVRIHSEAPFLSLEGVAVDWLCRYVSYCKVRIAANSMEGYIQLRDLIAIDTAVGADVAKVLYLPNYYPVPEKVDVPPQPSGSYFNVGCFGAIRPLKNQYIQALAAMTYAEVVGKRMRFHVNAGRREMGGDPILKNLVSLFSHSNGHQLVQHPWLERSAFIKLLRTMNISMCVSLSETFCIVAADSVVNGIPLVASWAIPWVKDGLARPTEISDIVEAIGGVLSWRRRPRKNFKALAAFSKTAQLEWISTIAG